MEPKHHQQKLLVASTILTLLNFAAVPSPGSAARSSSLSPSSSPQLHPVRSLQSPGPSPEGQVFSSPPSDISPSGAYSPTSPVQAPAPTSDLSPSDADSPISPFRALTPTSDISQSPSIAYPPTSPIQAHTPTSDLSPSPSIAYPPTSPIQAHTPTSDISPSPSIAYPPTSPIQGPTPSYDTSPSDAYSPTYDLSPSGSVPESSPTEAPSPFAKSLNTLFLSPISEILKNSDSIQEADSVGSPSPTENPEVKKLCDSTDYPGLCMSSITPFFNGETDPISILEMSINATIHITNFAITAATKLATAPETAPKISVGLEDCSDFYDDALSNLQSALEAIPLRDTGTINSLLNAALVDYGTCDKGFTQKNPLGNYDNKLTMMASNCLAIVSLVK
ncbi:hypothetical protein K2173_022285 [Erythroxylum novogranatense]|uniref:Pectinesterase inhibitor domain-containing protein n=1 Tax=Erythroxylum novogranatense TaxID=1862640 RepID=A0AAV8TH70_9ROSI|nr:hypothetical protein K2173_022285 [Erythroxylum novogranatense]